MLKIGFFCPGYESLGIEFLSASLCRQGFDTKLFFDPVLFSESNFIDQAWLAHCFSFRCKILKDLKEYSPDMVCFSVISDNYQWACRWAKDVKAATGARIIFGGIHPTSVPENVIHEQYVDYICLGEGDGALVELARAMANGGDDTGIRNIWKKQGHEIYRNPLRALVSDLDSLPFPDKGIFYKAYPIFRDGYLTITSRGCPYSCAYCCNNVYHELYKSDSSYFRRRSVGHVMAELELAKQCYNPRYIAFADDCFNHRGPWLQDFLQHYRHKVALPFSCYLYPDMVDEDQVRHLKEAGCFKVQMGMQVISQEKRNRILGRRSSQDNIARAIDLFRRYDIFVVCDAIFGFPDETEDELAQLARFYIDHPPDHCENFWLRYYPGTEITRSALAKGYIDEQRYAAIESGALKFGLCKRPEQPVGTTYAYQIRMLLMLYPFFSYNMREWWLEKRRYRYIPVISSMLMYVFVRLLHHPPLDLNSQRTWRRYVYFIKLKCFGV